MKKQILRKSKPWYRRLRWDRVFKALVVSVFVVSMVTKVYSDIYLQVQVPFGHYTNIQVEKGDSLWSLISAEGFNSTETQQLIEYVLDINNLDTVDIKVGDTLRIPTRR